MREPGVEHIKEAIGSRRSFQTAKLARVDLSLDIVNYNKIFQQFGSFTFGLLYLRDWNDIELFPNSRDDARGKGCIKYGGNWIG
jgi:hypothetical protein